MFTVWSCCYFEPAGLISSAFTCLPSAVDEGGGDGNPNPDRGPQSVCPSQHRPHWGAAEEEQSESKNDC